VGEARVVEELLAKLDLQDTIITMDAFHCKKNAKSHPGEQYPLSG
jgi:predicted transposase YbfD/YdcC